MTSINKNADYLNLNELEDISKLIKEEFLALPHQTLTLRRGQVIYYQGDKIENIGFVLEGVLKCARYTVSGDEVNPHFFYEGEIFPEYLLFSGESNYIYTLVAEKRSKIILTNFDKFKKNMKDDINTSQLIVSYMAKRGSQAEKWNMCNCFSSLRSRIAFMLLEIYEASDKEWTEITDNQRIISKKLQVSRPAYNQEIMKMIDENLIERNKNKIKILDQGKMESLI